MLYVVSVPIGNYEDITLRALNILKSSHLILSEDTRETAKLLQKYDIKTPQLSYRDQNHTRVFDHIKSCLDQEQDVCLVSDSGTPNISDPGFKLIKELVDLKYSIKTIPGPSSIIAALSISGLPTDKFCFLGFLPKTESHRTKIFEQYGNLDCTLTLFESPFRIRRLLSEIHKTLGDRKVCLAKDLTKSFEEVETAKLTEFLDNIESVKEKGEYVVLIAKEDF